MQTTIKDAANTLVPKFAARVATAKCSVRKIDEISSKKKRNDAASKNSDVSFAILTRDEVKKKTKKRKRKESKDKRTDDDSQQPDCTHRCSNALSKKIKIKKVNSLFLL